MALNARWNLHYVERFLKRAFTRLRIIGGGAQSDFWCQLYADVLGLEIHRPASPRQANARGAAFLASLALGLYPWQQIPEMTPIERTFRPDPSCQRVYNAGFAKFTQVYKHYRRLCRLLQKGRASNLEHDLP